jgi:hypothetical protein
MLDPNKLSYRVIANLCNRLNHLPTDKRLERIKGMSTGEAFDEFLNWEGIIGYTNILIKAYESIKAAEVQKGGS